MACLGNGLVFFLLPSGVLSPPGWSPWEAPSPSAEMSCLLSGRLPRRQAENRCEAYRGASTAQSPGEALSPGPLSGGIAKTLFQKLGSLNTEPALPSTSYLPATPSVVPASSYTPSSETPPGERPGAWLSPLQTPLQRPPWGAGLLCQCKPSVFTCSALPGRPFVGPGPGEGVAQRTVNQGPGIPSQSQNF